MNVLNIFFITFFISVSGFAQISDSEQSALKDIYRFSNGDSWKVKWDLKKDFTTWNGVTIVNDKVVALDLSANNLEGELPSSLSDLIYLQRLDLSGNALSGELPDALGNLENLEVLALSGNELSGEIPSDLYKLKFLKKIQLADNGFQGLAGM